MCSDSQQKLLQSISCRALEHNLEGIKKKMELTEETKKSENLKDSKI